jgi:TorA maturation chaperone TorD
LDQYNYSLLSRLWLSEPDEATLTKALALPGMASIAATADELSVAYTDLFLLNVYPYASVFLNSNGEMNGVRSRELQALYLSFGYQPEDLYKVGAPDHIGLSLGLLAHIPQAMRSAVLSRYILDWVPVLCLAVERQPAVHPFYRALAVHTRQELFLDYVGKDRTEETHLPFQPSMLEDWIELPMVNEGEERQVNPVSVFQPSTSDDWIDLPLAHVVQRLLSPDRSGVFLSRNQLGHWARRLEVPLAFGERNRLGISLFEAAGLVERVFELFEWILMEVRAWDASYIAWAEEYPAWLCFAGEWRERTTATIRFLEEAHETLNIRPKIVSE